MYGVHLSEDAKPAGDLEGRRLPHAAKKKKNLAINVWVCVGVDGERPSRERFGDKKMAKWKGRKKDRPRTHQRRRHK